VQIRPPAPVIVAPAGVQSKAVSLDAYKREVAESLLAANPGGVYRERPPVILYGVVVLQFAVNADGTASRISLLRVPSHAPELGPRAVQAVQRASPFTVPSNSITHGEQLTLTESLLFRDDGKFIARTLAQPQ
jgi:periplasmic protein TonB